MLVDAARASARDVERVVCAVNPNLPDGPKQLRAQIQATLIHASDVGLLRSAPHQIFSLLNLITEPAPGGLVAALTCGETLDKGQHEGVFLYRADGARLSFSITARFPRREAPTLIAYRFHVAFSAGLVPPFVRFDLNRPGDDLDPIREPRSHVHPGSDALRLPAPIMSPQQLVHSFLYGLVLK